MMARINETLGDKAAVSSDFIVGFCGETDEEYQLTVDLLKECRFKNSFIFKYSERPGTKASDHLPDDIPFDVKRERNRHLLSVQNQISEEDNHRFLGSRVEVLVEGPSKKVDIETIEPGAPMQLTGRTHCDRIVVFEGTERLVGQIIPIAVYDSTNHTLIGTVVTDTSGGELLKLSTATS